jgi:hypothetical protein
VRYAEQRTRQILEAEAEHPDEDQPPGVAEAAALALDPLEGATRRHEQQADAGVKSERLRLRRRRISHRRPCPRGS